MKNFFRSNLHNLYDRCIDRPALCIILYKNGRNIIPDALHDNKDYNLYKLET